MLLSQKLIELLPEDHHATPALLRADLTIATHIIKTKGSHGFIILCILNCFHRQFDFFPVAATP